MGNKSDTGKSVYSRYDTLNQYYCTAYPDLSHELALTRFMDRSWLDPERPMPECIHELHALAEMHTQNLRALNTDRGIQYYLINLDFPSAISVDLEAKKSESSEEFLKTEQHPSVVADPHQTHHTTPNTPNTPNKPQQPMNENTKLERTFLVQCSKEQLIALGKYMNAQGIFFKKCSDGLNTEAHAEIFPATTQTDDGTVRPQ